MKGKPQDNSAAHFEIAANARTDEFHEGTLEIHKMWNQIIVEGCLTFPVNL